MVRAELRPTGPYSLRLSGRLASDACRVVVDGTFRSTIRVEGRLEQVQAVQRVDGTIVVDAASEAGVEHVGSSSGSTTTTQRSSSGLRTIRCSARRCGTSAVFDPCERDRRAGAPPRRRRAADPGEARAPDRAQHHPRRVTRTRRHARGADVRGAGRILARAAGAARARCATGRSADPALSHVRARVAQGASGGSGRRQAEPRARARPLVGRRHLPGRARPLRVRARPRPRSREARSCALGPLGRGRGDGRAAATLRRVGRASRASTSLPGSAAVSYPCPMPASSPELHVLPHPGRAVAELLAEHARRGGSIVLTGGSSVAGAYREAASLEPTGAR